MTNRFEEIKAQYRRWPGDVEPNGNWGADVSWLIDEVDALRVQLAERDEYYRMVINEACQAPDEKHCTCVPALRAEVERLRKQYESKPSCRWTYDWHQDTWDTSCGQSFTVIDSTPSQNDMRYCPYCGGVLDEIIEKRALEDL